MRAGAVSFRVVSSLRARIEQRGNVGSCLFGPSVDKDDKFKLALSKIDVPPRKTCSVTAKKYTEEIRDFYVE
jgi:hypothetical protein